MGLRTCDYGFIKIRIEKLYYSATVRPLYSSIWRCLSTIQRSFCVVSWPSTKQWSVIYTRDQGTFDAAELEVNLLQRRRRPPAGPIGWRVNSSHLGHATVILVELGYELLSHTTVVLRFGSMRILFVSKLEKSLSQKFDSRHGRLKFHSPFVG